MIWTLLVVVAAVTIAVIGCALVHPDRQEQTDDDWSRADSNDTIRPR
ncbi:MAG TPA: hypothetical protein VFL55_24645 [Acetobacteraceae bacterium]|nr:hypothetical protein [Acetobacteraceae bacterium]